MGTSTDNHLAVQEFSDIGLVRVGKVFIEGFVDDEHLHHVCLGERVYYEKFDAYCCPRCNVWDERSCGGSDCTYCAQRPETPFSDVAIQKAGAIIIRDRKVLMTRTREKEIFVNPGGKLEEEETPAQALIRELREELGITVAEGDFEPFGTFHAEAAYDPGKSVTMHVFLVHRWEGEIVVQREIEELAWIGSQLPIGISIGSIMQYEVLPRLKERGMID